MARLEKQRARKPIVEGGAALGTVSWRGGEAVYSIDIYPRDPHDPHYEVHLTRGEMLQTISSWIEKEARDERERIEAQRKAAAKAA